MNSLRAIRPVSDDIVSFLEESITGHKILRVSLSEGVKEVLPKSIYYINEQLHLIGIMATSGHLRAIELSQISNICEAEDLGQMSEDIDRDVILNYISQLKESSGTEVRLVLKLHSMINFDIQVKHDLIRRPSLILNPQGELIWAGTLSPSRAIYEWLAELGADIEILDPIDFAKDYLSFWQEQRKKA